MKKILFIILITFGFSLLMACSNKAQKDSKLNLSNEESQLKNMEKIPNEINQDNDEIKKILIKIGDKSFNATLLNNESTNEFISQFPITMQMDELNGNEKFCFLPNNLHTNPQVVGDIKNGDIMLYGSDCLVLFYKNFTTSYSYTRLGFIDDASDFDKSLGSGSVTVTWSIVK